MAVNLVLIILCFLLMESLYYIKFFLTACKSRIPLKTIFPNEKTFMALSSLHNAFMCIGK